MTTRAQRVLNYRGIGLPAGYTCPAVPYGNTALGNGVRAIAPAGAQARLKLQVISTTLADYDGKQIRLHQINTEGATTFTITFDDDAPPPSTASAINLQGLTTVAQIAEQIAIAFEACGFRVVDKGAGLLWVYQPIGGDQGNTEVEFPSGDLSGEFAINGISDFVGFDTKFYGGSAINVPVLWGPRRGMCQSTPDLVQFEQVPV